VVTYLRRCEMNTRLKELRKKIDLTQIEFSKRIDLNRSSYANIELGNVNITERNIKKICSEFNVNEDWLKNGNGEMFYSMKEDKELLNFVINILADKNEFVRKTFSTLAKLDKSEWAVIEKIINSLQK